jgi:transposase
MERYTVRCWDGIALWVGIDLHRLQWHVTIRTLDVEAFTGSIPGSWEALRRLLERYQGSRVHAVYEAGYFGYWLYDALTAWGARCVVTPPSLIPQEAGNRVKTDRRDSRKLALLLCKGMLKSVWVPTVEQRGRREVLRRRSQILSDRVRVQCRIKAALRFSGVEAVEPSGSWSQRAVRGLRNIVWPDRWQHESFGRLLDEYQYLCQQLKRQTELLSELAATPDFTEDVQILKSLKGVGTLSAMEILLELPAIGRFRRSDQVAAYVGLTPAQYSSGEHIRLGRITGAGKSHLRGTLIEIAWRVIAKDVPMRQVYERIKARSGAKRAIVAVARRLLLCFRRMLLDRQPYIVRQAA